MKYCAFLTMGNPDGFEIYDHLLTEPMKKYGWYVENIPWREKDVNWDRFDAVIVRSPWDYHHFPEPFIKVLETIDESTAHLENSLGLIRWNLNKRYLLDLQAKDVPIVPTKWPAAFTVQMARSGFEHFETNKIIVKPTVGAGADDTFWITRESSTGKLRKMEETFRDRPVMMQPFMENIITEGEFSLFYFDGSYSHSILKTPEAGDFRVQEEHGGRLKLVNPEPHLKEAGQKIMQALPEIPLYTRVDVVRTNNNHFALMELELIEPSLYFNMDEDSPARFARVFDRRMGRRAETGE